jgi:hypothetical protein
MKTAITIITLVLSFVSTSQTLVEEMGGIDSNFEFYSNGKKLDVQKQILIERSTAKASYSEVENESYGYGYAYVDWRIEFVSSNMIISRNKEKPENIWHRGRYELRLKNDSGGILLTQYLHQNMVNEWSGNTGEAAVYTYSINLHGLPVVILNNVAVVEIVRIN